MKENPKQNRIETVAAVCRPKATKISRKDQSNAILQNFLPSQSVLLCTQNAKIKLNHS